MGASDGSPGLSGAQGHRHPAGEEKPDRDTPQESPWSQEWFGSRHAARNCGHLWVKRTAGDMGKTTGFRGVPWPHLWCDGVQRWVQCNVQLGRYRDPTSYVAQSVCNLCPMPRQLRTVDSSCTGRHTLGAQQPEFDKCGQNWENCGMYK